MNIWKDVFETWSNFCQFVRRELIPKARFVQWAERLGIISASQRDYFYVYLKILEDGNALCPLSIGIDKLNYQNNKLYFYNQAEDEPLYHPIQFLDVLKWFKDRRFKTKPYFNISEECTSYFRRELIRYRIKKIKEQIELNERLEYNIPDQQNHLETLETELQTIVSQEYPDGVGLISHLSHSILEPLFDKPSLILWIKLESLCLQEEAHIYGPIPHDMHLTISNFEDKKEIDLYRERYQSWFDQLIENPSESFKEGDYEILKSFHFRLSQRLRETDFREASWDDLFDLVSSRKKDRVLGYASLYINLFSVKRYLERACWLLYRKNIVYGKELDKIPYFCYTDYHQFYDKQYIFYSYNTILDFGLYPINPFILYVEGASDYVIMEEFLKKTLGWRFRIKNMKSADNAIHIEKFHKPIEDQHCYFFDFDKKQKYEKRKEVYSGRASFFFPDFMTENFTVNEVLNALKQWTNEINIKIENNQLEQINSNLKNEKDISNRLLDELKTHGKVLKNVNSKGYEKVIINYLKQYFSRSFFSHYGDILRLDSTNRYIHKDYYKEFKDLVKTEISNRLKLIVAQRLEGDPERRSSKFSFEQKLDLLYKKINAIIDHRIENLK